MDDGGVGIEHGLAQPHPVDDGRHLALHEQLLDDEDVHLPGAGHGRHVLDEVEIMLEGLDRDVGIDHALGLAVGCQGLVPDRAAILPDEGVDLHGREVVALTGLVRDAVEVVVGDAVTQGFAGGAAEELADIAEGVPVDVLPVLVGAGQRLAEALLDRRRLALVAEEVLAVEGDVGVGNCREPRNSRVGCGKTCFDIVLVLCG